MSTYAYQCPRCHTKTPPQVVSSISTGGWIFFIIFLFICFPISFFGFTMKEETRFCPLCGVDVGLAWSHIQGQQLRQQRAQARLDRPKTEYAPLKRQQVIWIISGLLGLVMLAGLILWRAIERRRDAQPRYDYSPLPTPTITPRPSPSPSATVRRKRARLTKP